MPKKEKKLSKLAAFFTSPRWAYVGSFLLSIILVWLAFRFQHRIEHFRSLGLLGIFLINLIGSSTLFLPAPAIASVVAGGVVFPPFLVALVAAFGASLGDMLGYILGRTGKHIVLNHTEKKWFSWFRSIFSRFADILIFAFAFLPNPFFDGIGILAGISEYPPTKFFLLMFVGRFARNVLLALIGAKL
ncbi:MAG TPA: VTT domain-containing protein [Patescibacteria group bacterium]|nr:VTT domain-containing protein [Patescibacteria group bacterium]